MERPEGEDHPRRTVSRFDASNFIIAWLRANFKHSPGAFLSREEAYDPYVAHCERMHYEHTTLAVFAKLFKKAFPDAETKRVIRDGTAPRRCWADMAFCPSSSAPAFIPPRPAPIPTAITWVKENAKEIYHEEVRYRAARKRSREDATSVGCTTDEPLPEGLPTTSSATGDDSNFDGDDGDDDRGGSDQPSEFHYVEDDDDDEQTMTIGRTGAQLEAKGVLVFISQVYIKELWGINPINPATTEVELLWRGVLSAQSSTLALTSCLLMSSASFLMGHWPLAKHYFRMARHHLGVLFDTADYDIACVLLPLSWWSRLYAENHDEGMEKQVYYVTLGQQICENCGAQNDDTYRNLTYMGASLANRDPSSRIAASQKRVPYTRSWKPVQGLTHSRPDNTTDLGIRQMICQVHAVVYPVCEFYQQYGRNHPEWKERTDVLKDQLGVVIKLEETLVAAIKADQACTRMYTMMRCEVCATRTFILWALRSEQQLYAATNFVLLLLEVPLPIMVMTTHELTINDYLFMRVPVDILVAHKSTELLAQLYDLLMAHAKSFYWMRHFCQYIRQRVPNVAPHAPPTATLTEIDCTEPQVGRAHV